LANKDVIRINRIIKNTISVIQDSKDAIFDIAESARKEVQELMTELKKLRHEATEMMNECESLEIKVANGRKKLAAINKNYDAYTEKEMAEAYQKTQDLIVQLAVARERERQVIIRRNEIEVRLKNALETVQKAEKLVIQVGTVLDYLSGDLQKVDEHLEDCENKRILAIRVIKAQEDERHRIAREIHDGPAQSMSNVVLKAEICGKLAGIDINKAITELNELKDIVRDCLKDVRRIIYDLRPMSIDDLGLKPTLQKYIENFKEDNQMNLELKMRGNIDRIKDNNIVLAVFRVVQECLNNVRKHAKASFVSVQLECNDKNITIRVKDDGKGFDTSLLDELEFDENGGFGLLGMKERVELLEGSFSIKSSVGSGTTVCVKLPNDLQGVT